MITEFTLLRLLPGFAKAFESALARVAPLLAAADGYLGHRLVSTLDSPDRYLLEVVCATSRLTLSALSRVRHTCAS